MNNHPIITLLTDFGNRDPFVGIMKGVIYNINPDVKVVDLTHEIAPQDIFSGAFSLYQAYNYFPKGTIHIAVVDPGVGSDRKSIIIKTDDYTFVCPDNGIASLAVENENSKLYIYEISNKDYMLSDVSNTFHGRDIFAPAGAHLSKNIRPDKFGPALNDFISLNIPVIDVKQNNTKAVVIHIDKFGNLITNITKNLVDNIKCIHIKGHKIEKINTSYNEKSTCEYIAILGSADFLEISMYTQNAAQALGLKVGDEIIIDFT